MIPSPNILRIMAEKDRKAIKHAGSELEWKFERLWLVFPNSQPLIREHRFHHGRRWRFDFAHVESMTAIELEGGVWSNGRHTRGKGFTEDCLKYNQAALDGWTVFRLTSSMITAYQLGRIIDHIKTHTRLKEQVAHLSQFARYSRDLGDGIAHGGASVCQACYNKANRSTARYGGSIPPLLP